MVEESTPGGDCPAPPAELWVVELRALNARINANLEVLATAINALSERITALDNRLRSQEGSVTDHNAELLGKAIRHMSHG